jgi:hypothetical protein
MIAVSVLATFATAAAAAAAGASCSELTALLVGAARLRYLPPGVCRLLKPIKALNQFDSCSYPWFNLLYPADRCVGQL